MKKGFGSYIVLWLALVSLFNIICFVTPAQINGFDKFGGSFWSGYIFIMLAFAAHFVYSLAALSEKNREKRTLNMPLRVISWLELLCMVIIGSVCMITPGMPNWLGIVLCYAVLALSVILLAAAKTVGENTAAGNHALNSRTDHMRGLTDRAAELAAMAKTNAAKESARKIYEALRYSDPVSSEATATLEREISAKLEEFAAIAAGDNETEAVRKAGEITALAEKRSNACRAAKRSR